MNVSVIIPAINEAEHIGVAVVRAYEAGAAEVIVADGGSSDVTREIARRHRARVVDSPSGRARQQNFAAAEASSSVLLFQHADNHLSADCINQVKSAMQDERCQFGAFRQRIDAAGCPFRLLEWGNAWRVRKLGIAYGDQAIFVRRELFERIGGFPEVPWMEDLILMKQLRPHGRPVLLEGPVSVSARRWIRHGVIRQTLRNWSLVAAFQMGVSPERLARRYRRHDVGR